MASALSFLTNGQTNSPTTLYGNTATSGPAWMQDYTQGLIAQANAMASQPYPTYSGSLVAPLNSAQNQSFSEVEGLQGGYQGALSQAQALAQSSANPSALQQASGYLPTAQNLTTGALSQTGLQAASPYLQASSAGATPGAISQYMNPYINDVVQQADYQQNLNFNQNVLPGINDQFIKNGQYGSAANQREADRAAQSLDTSEQMNTGAILGQGYSTAQQGALAAAGLQGQLGATAGGLGTQAEQAQLAAGQQEGALGQISGGLGYEQGVLGLQGANQEGALGQLGQTLGLQGASALNAAGNQQQAQAQTSANTAYQQFMQQQQYPEQQASWLSGIMQSTANPYETGANTQTANQTIPNSSQISNSPLSQALGTYSSLTGLANMFGTGTNSNTGVLNGVLGAGTSSQLGTTLDPNSVYGGNSALSQANLYSPNENLTSGYGSPSFSTPSFSFPSYANYPMYHSGGPVYRARGGALPRVEENWYEGPFQGASGQAAKRFGIGGINWDTSSPSDIGGMTSSGAGIGGIDWGTPDFFSNDPSTSYADPNQISSEGPALTGALQSLPGSSGSASPTLGGVLGDVNQGAGLYNAGSKLTGGTGISGTTAGSALGTANDIYGLYNAAAHPGVATGISGGSGAADLYSKVSGNSLGILGQTLGGAGDIAGIYNAIKNPSVGNVASGALDAYKLYGIGSNLLAPSAADAAAGALGTSAGAGTAAGAGTTAADAFSGIGGATDAGAAAGGAGSGAIGGAIASLGAVAVPLAAAGVLGEVISGIVQGNQRGPAMTINAAPGITQNPDGKLPSGNSIAFDSNIGLGEGNNEAQGSGQLYRLNPSGSASNNTVYDWLGQSDTNQAIQAYTDLQNAKTNATPYGQSASSTGNIFTTPKGNAQSDAQWTSMGNTAYSDLFNNSGGAKAWGMSEPQFVTTLQFLQGNANANGGSGLGVGNG